MGTRSLLGEAPGYTSDAMQARSESAAALPFAALLGIHKIAKLGMADRVLVAKFNSRPLAAVREAQQRLLGAGGGSLGGDVVGIFGCPFDTLDEFLCSLSEKRSSKLLAINTLEAS